MPQLALDLSRDTATRNRLMRWYQDSRAADALFSDGSGNLLGGQGGKFVSFTEGQNDDGTAITVLWVSKFHDQGHPNNEKTYQDLVIEHDTGDAYLTVTAVLDNGDTQVALGTINSTSKTQTTFQFTDEHGLQAKNCAIKIEGDKENTDPNIIIYSAFYHYYLEARGALTWDSDEQDGGVQNVKAIRAVEVDLDNPAEVTAYLYTDMPGTAMALRDTKTIPVSTTRRKYQVPFGRPYHEARHYRVVMQTAVTGTEFQLYGARIELQPFGEYVEAYQASAGRDWDSGTLELGSPRVKEIKEVQLLIDTDGALTFNLHTELPGLQMQPRSTKTVNTEPTTAGERMVNLPLLATGLPVEGRLVRCYLGGTAAWRLYKAWLLARPIGYYVEAYVAADGHIWDSTVLDLGSPGFVKRLDKLYFEAHAESPLTVTVYTGNANDDMGSRGTYTLPLSTGPRSYIVQLTGIYGRLVRVTISSTAGWRLFKSRIFAKPIGVWLNAGSDEVFSVEAEQDLATERVKPFKEIQLVYDSAEGGTCDFYTDLPDTDAQLVKTFALATTTGTESVKLRLPGYAKGRLLRVDLKPGTGDLQVFKCRVWTRTIGEAGLSLWKWIPLPIPQTPDNYAPVDVWVAPTPPDWEWQPIYVPPTLTEKWNWVDLPVAA